MTRFILGALVLALAGSSPTAAPVPRRASGAFGPPWISIEYPVNPYDRTTKDAYLLVHAFHHGTPVDFPVAGTAEGLVNGQRRSITLAFAPTSRPGVFALSRQWPNEGTWTLVVSVAQGVDDKVFAVVDLARSGDVQSVRVPSTRRPDGLTLPAKVAMSEIEASLKTRAGPLAAGR